MRRILHHAEEVIAQIALVLVAACVFAQVVSRYVFGTAITWTEELAGFAMVWAVYMGASMAVRDRFHIRIMFAVEALPRPLGLAVLILGDLLWLAFCALMLLIGYEYIALLWQREYVSPSLGIDQKWPQSIIIIGYLAMVARIVQLYAQWLASGRRGLPGIPDGDEWAEGGKNGSAPQ